SVAGVATAVTADRSVAGAADGPDTGAADTGAADSADAGSTATASARQSFVGNEHRAHQRGGRKTDHHMTHHGISFPVRYLIATEAPCVPCQFQLSLVQSSFGASCAFASPNRCSPASRDERYRSSDVGN